MLENVKNLAKRLAGKKSFWASVLGIALAGGAAISPPVQAALMGLVEAVLG